MVGYTRQSAADIVTSNTIQASHFNAEYNLLQSSFDSLTGHNHDGTTGGGAKIPPAGMTGLTNTSSGLLCADGANSLNPRTLTGTSNEITVTNGTGASGNPTLSLPSALTFTGKTVTGGTFTTPTINVNANVLSIRDNTDTTKIAQFVCSTIGTGTTRSFTLPNANGTVALTSDISALSSVYQSLDSTLTSLAAYNTNGILTQTAADTFTGRTITGTTNRLSVTNGNGVAGNPTLDIDANYVGQTTITTLGTISTGVWQGTAVGISYGGTGQTTANAAFNALAPSQTTHSGKFLTTDGTNTSWATVAAGFTDPGANGVVVRTSLNTSTARTITAGANIAVTNGDGVSGNPTIALNGTVPVANGGTGATTLTANNVILGNGTSAVQFVAPGTSGNILTSNGTTWTSSAPAASGTVTSVATSGGLTGGTITSSGTISINTNNSVGIGAYAILKQSTGSSISNGAVVTTGVSDFQYVKWNSGGSITATTNVTNGQEWRNVSGVSIANNEYGMFIRVS